MTEGETVVVGVTDGVPAFVGEGEMEVVLEDVGDAVVETVGVGEGDTVGECEFWSQHSPYSQARVAHIILPRSGLALETLYTV